MVFKLGKRNKEETEKALESAGKFDFSKSSAGMADLMRRLYQVRFQCGVVEDDDARKKQLEEQKRAMKKMDNFELTKVDIVNMINEVRELLDDREKNPNDIQVKTAIKKKLPQIDAEFKKLQKYQEMVKGKLGIWEKKTMDPELLKQREADIALIKSHIEELQQRHRKMVMGGDGGRGDKKFDKRKPQFDDISTLKDESKQEELPAIDISEGLKQIEEKKKMQDEKLTVIGMQLDKLKGIAVEMGDELDVQLKMLEKMDRDVDKYNQSLGKLNSQLDKAIATAGGPTKLLLIAIIGMIILALIGGLYLLVQQLIQNAK